jgi:hypothetical protein
MLFIKLLLLNGIICNRCYKSVEKAFIFLKKLVRYWISPVLPERTLFQQNIVFLMQLWQYDQFRNQNIQSRGWQNRDSGEAGSRYCLAQSDAVDGAISTR